MSGPKTIAVLGATGNQGGSVVTTFLANGWSVRAITRDASSKKAEALASRGAKVVQADMENSASLESAFTGAQAIFAVSDFWGLYNDPANKDKPATGQPLNVWAGETETQQLKNVIDAAAKVDGLERFILSSLSHASKWSKGKYTHVYHFDSKAVAEEYGAQTYPTLWTKTSVYQAGLFVSNFLGNPITTPRKTSNGALEFVTSMDPDLKLPFIVAEEDSGPFVKALVDDSPGKKLIGYREWISLQEFAALFASELGLSAQIKRLPNEGNPLGLPEHLAIEIQDNFAYFNEFGYEARDDPAIVHPNQLSTPPSLGNIEEYLKKQDLVSIVK